MMHQRFHGQGVVEYAGALTIGAILISTMMGFGVDGLEALYTTIYTAVSGFLQGAASAL